ncbi:hypothetical protein HMPREF0724_10676 [Prescottella equi ATCC 33707]|uniref:Uncharacterized protein n=1 Tax=Prescottella equi ATCC 33707 TaxID=525370 RepID=E9SX25_RHOHA|nr:hypothetical protein HMPREF0724_10676 [Prescottella equi ATCC 33707]
MNPESVGDQPVCVLHHTDKSVWPAAKAMIRVGTVGVGCSPEVG